VTSSTQRSAPWCWLAWEPHPGPGVAIGNLSTWWVYLLGPVIGAVIAVGVAYVLRGPAKAEEASAAEGQSLDRAA
jgi:aquaporin Z